MTVLTLSINVHGIGPEAVSIPPEALFARFAHGRYAYTVGLRRILDMLERRGLKATFFWPVTEIERAPQLFEACLAAGHEIGAHGVAFEDLMSQGRAEQQDLLGGMTEALEERIGAKPQGFRSATGTLSPDTLPILASLGYFVDDDAPYRLDEDGGAGMVELPLFEGLTDAHYFRRRMTQERAEMFLIEELDALLPVAGYGALVLHPRSDIGSARAARLLMIERVLDRAVERHGARIVPCREALGLATG